MRGIRPALVAAIALAWVPPSAAWAQSSGQSANQSGSHVLGTFGDDPTLRRGGGRGGRGAPPPPAAPALRRPQEVWPRLDAGAVLCRSRDELVARARMEADQGIAAMPQGCRLVRNVTAITIVDRVPPGATQVKVRDNGETGWTDAFLPDRPPGS